MRPSPQSHNRVIYGSMTAILGLRLTQVLTGRTVTKSAGTIRNLSRFSRAKKAWLNFPEQRHSERTPCPDAASLPHKAGLYRCEGITAEDEQFVCFDSIRGGGSAMAQFRNSCDLEGIDLRAVTIYRCDLKGNLRGKPVTTWEKVVGGGGRKLPRLSSLGMPIAIHLLRNYAALVRGIARNANAYDKRGANHANAIFVECGARRGADCRAA